MYRRGVVSDTEPFSRPLPLCGKNQRAVRAIRLRRASPVGPPWYGGCRAAQLCRAGVAGTLCTRQDSVKLKNLSYNIATEAKKIAEICPALCSGGGGSAIIIRKKMIPKGL